MKFMTKISLLFVSTVIAGLTFITPAKAATSANIDIHVSIAGNKSVLIVGATFYDFGALAINTSSVSASAIVVQNDSTVFVETYTITGADAISRSGGTNWDLEESTGAADDYALGAQFSTLRPDQGSGAWTDDLLITSARNCTANKFGNGTEAQSGTNVAVGANRNLWFKMHTPQSVTDGGEHDITLTVSVL